MTRNTKTVVVKGYRSNDGYPQSWWNETGIFVNAGDTIEFDTTNNTGENNPGFAPSFGPEGDIYRGQTSEDNKDWPYSLAYVQGETLCWFGSLIGKVGTEGDAFCIGASGVNDPITIIAPRTGFLFLAFNDGVNFEDNDPAGFWDVDVTFEEAVRLDPDSLSYGTNMIYADRVNTCLVKDLGVILTVQVENWIAIPEWDAVAIANVQAACSAVDTRLQAQTDYTFKEVFGGVELRLWAADEAGRTHTTGHLIRFGTVTQNTITRDSDDDDARNYGRTEPNPLFPGFDYYPSDYGFFSAGSLGIQNTVIHELGHVLKFRTELANPTTNFYSTAGDFSLPSLNNNQSGTDSSGDVGTFWEHGDTTDVGEWVADHFLNWARDSYFGIEENIDNYSTGMAPEEKRVSAFWKGSISYDGDTSPGIQGFASEVEDMAEAMWLLVAGFGPGIAVEDCSYHTIAPLK